MSKPKIIAFYLPQYHPTPDNDKWWGRGFTEWTNVGKAKPLFKGHYQPKVPADLGYYDLRLPEVREAQAELAKEAGIYGFCYWSYWFGNGKEELELPFNEVLRLGKPEFPFMLCWCNESWYRKMWNKDAGGNIKELLLEQQYPGKEDIINHFYHRLPAFRDKRYIKYDNKPLFMIYDWQFYPDVSEFIKIWRELSKKEGFDDIIFIAHQRGELSISEEKKIFDMGFDYINYSNFSQVYKKSYNIFQRTKNKFINIFIKKPIVISYRKFQKNFYNIIKYEDKIFPTLYPNWDPTARRGYNTAILNDAQPIYFKELCKKVLLKLKEKKGLNIIFIRAWNEWGEGNYMEPDLKYGKGYIKALRDAINENSLL